MLMKKVVLIALLLVTTCSRQLTEAGHKWETSYCCAPMQAAILRP